MGSRGSWVVLIHGYTDSARRMWLRQASRRCWRKSIASWHSTIATTARAISPFRTVPAASASPAGATAPSPDLTKLTIPILAINGSFDAPHAKTRRLWREAKTFENVILPGKTHLTAAAIGAPMTPLYADALRRFIETFDET
jgi:pimeloyl-ACP methyl ester carboxylesterase